MSKDMGYGKHCWIDLNSKKADCGDKYNNIQTTCKREKVFVSTENKEKTPSATGMMVNGVRDTSIDYNYFRAGRTQ
jgi:hypothetical protein